MQKMAVLAMIPKVLGERSRRVYKPRQEFSSQNLWLLCAHVAGHKVIAQECSDGSKNPRLPSLPLWDLNVMISENT